MFLLVAVSTQEASIIFRIHCFSVKHLCGFMKVPKEFCNLPETDESFFSDNTCLALQIVELVRHFLISEN